MGELAGQSKQLLDEQAKQWPLLRDNLAALQKVRVRDIDCGDFVMRVQFNPARIASTGAKIDERTIRERKCFLCDANRPHEQRAVPFLAGRYKVLCNPFPIFPEHFTIPSTEHRPQRIAHAFGDFLDLAAAMSPRYTVFYNGPKSGASAPDHLHFQAGDRAWMPIEGELEKLRGEPIAGAADLAAYASRTQRPFLALESHDRATVVSAFNALHRNLANIAPDPDEPQMNVIAWFDETAGYHAIVLPRAKHRPSFYYAEGDERILLSPGCVDLGGVCIVPLEHDFLKLNRGLIEQMLREVMLGLEPFARLCDALAAVVR